MAAARKTPRRSIPTKRGIKRKSATPARPAGPVSPATTVLPTDMTPEHPGFLIVGIGASAGGLAAMEEMRQGDREGGGSG